jgi:hypothetical protein
MGRDPLWNLKKSNRILDHGKKRVAEQFGLRNAELDHGFSPTIFHFLANVTMAKFLPGRYRFLEVTRCSCWSQQGTCFPPTSGKTFESKNEIFFQNLRKVGYATSRKSVTVFFSLIHFYIGWFLTVFMYDCTRSLIFLLLQQKIAYNLSKL